MCSDRAREPGLGLAWSLWTELGVPGPYRRHSSTIVDPERLIVATPRLARDDPRLLDLVFAWCAQHAHRVSASRLSTLLKEARAEVRSAAELFLGELAAAGTPLVRVPPAPPPQPRDRRDIIVPMARPALLRLRMRGLVGVGGRADVLVTLLSSPATWWSASELDDVGIAKRNVARVLAELGEAGIAHTRRRGNTLEYRLVNPTALGELVALPPHATFPDWRGVFEWMHLADELGQLDPARSATLRVEVAHHREALESLVAALGLELPYLGEAVDEAALVRWVIERAEAFARPVDGP